MLSFLNQFLLSRSVAQAKDTQVDDTKTILAYTPSEKKQLKKLFNEQWQAVPDMTLDERYFFIADYLVPEDQYKIDFAEYETIPVHKFKLWALYAYENNVITVKQALELS